MKYFSFGDRFFLIFLKFILLVSFLGLKPRTLVRQIYLNHLFLKKKDGKRLSFLERANNFFKLIQ